jgi:hypothetical protein
MTAEDLTTQTGVVVQPNLSRVPRMGLSHVERNGHHYANGLAAASERVHASLPEGASGFRQAIGLTRTCNKERLMSLEETAATVRGGVVARGRDIACQPASRGTYREDRSDGWSYDHSSVFDAPWSVIPCTKPKRFLGLTVNARLGAAAGVLLNSRWIRAYAGCSPEVRPLRLVGGRFSLDTVKSSCP